MWLKRTWYGGGCVLVLTALVWGYQQGYRVNLSASYPPGIYQIIDHSQRVRVGELVLFCPPNTPDLREALVRGYIKPGQCPGHFQPAVKKVAALPGTMVSLSHTIQLNGVTVPDAVVQRSDSEGRPLPRLASFVVPPATVLLLSDYAPMWSFDSRYYGAVPQDHILGHITPVFNF